MRPEDLSIRKREVLRAVEWSRSRAFLLYLEFNTEQWTVENEWLGLYRREVLENMIQNNQWSIDTMNILSGSGVSCVDSILIYKARLCVCPSVPLLSQMCYFCSILLIIFCYVILRYFCFEKEGETRSYLG